MKQKLTPWFDGSIKPVRVGVYERLIPNCAMTAFWYWNGRHWQFGGESIPSKCYVRPAGDKSYEQALPWRGLAVKP